MDERHFRRCAGRTQGGQGRQTGEAAEGSEENSHPMPLPACKFSLLALAQASAALSALQTLLK